MKKDLTYSEDSKGEKLLQCRHFFAQIAKKVPENKNEKVWS